MTCKLGLAPQGTPGPGGAQGFGHTTPSLRRVHACATANDAPSLRAPGPQLEQQAGGRSLVSAPQWDPVPVAAWTPRADSIPGAQKPPWAEGVERRPLWILPISQPPEDPLRSSDFCPSLGVRAQPPRENGQMPLLLDRVTNTPVYFTKDVME